MTKLSDVSSRRRFLGQLGGLGGFGGLGAMAGGRGAAMLLPGLAAAVSSGCGHAPKPALAPTAYERELLAPSGTLRIGVYLGSPTSMVKNPSGQERGLGVEVGQALAAKLALPWRLVNRPRLVEVLEGIKTGQLDFTITNATAARAADMLFTTPLVELELGYLALPGARVADIGGVDQVGVRVGVTQGSTSQGTLGRQLKHASVVPATTLQAAADMLKAGQIDVYATNKAILFEMADGLAGAQVLEGHWGLEQLAIAIPKGREAALGFVNAFAQEVRAQGLVRRAGERAGLRGMRAAS